MPPNTINASELEQLPARYCIALDEDDCAVIMLTNEVVTQQVIGNRLFSNRREAQQHLRVIDALAGCLNQADRLRAAAWLWENDLLS